MTELSLSAINATAPYHLRISELGGFDFDIDAGLTYNIALIEDYRARLFSRWFRDYADDSKYSLLTTSLKVGNVTNYLGADILWTTYDSPSVVSRTTEGFFKAIPSNYQAVHPNEEPILDAGFEKVLDDLLIPK